MRSCQDCFTFAIEESTPFLTSETNTTDSDEDVGVIWFAFMFSNFYQLDIHNKTCVALANLR